MLKFLCYCTGAKWNILKKCPSQIPLYASMGGAILLTSVLAFISGSYALYTVFGDVYTAVAFGLVWGITIFNLDRLIVMSIRKREDRKWWMEILQALPRLVLAVFISLVIAKPLEIRIFESKLEYQLALDKRTALERLRQDLNVSYDTATYRNQITELEDERKVLEDELKNEPQDWDYQQLKQDFLNAKADWQDTKARNESKRNTAYSRYLSLKSPYKKASLIPDSLANKRERAYAAYAEYKRLGDEIIEKDSDWKKKEKELQDLGLRKGEEIKKEIVQIEKDIFRQVTASDSVLIEKGEEAKEQQTGIEVGYSSNLIAYLGALENLINNDKTGMMFWANILITLLFIALESAPVISKLLLHRTKYDELLELKEREESNDAKDEANMRFSHLHELNEELGGKRKEVITDAIKYISEEKWKKEVEKIDSEEAFKAFVEKISDVRLTQSKSKGIFIPARAMVYTFLVIPISLLLYLADFNKLSPAPRDIGKEQLQPVLTPQKPDSTSVKQDSTTLFLPRTEEKK